MERFEAHDLLPVARSRSMMWAWKLWCADLAKHIARVVRDSRAIIISRCPFERGFLWLGSSDPGLRLAPALMSMYQHPRPVAMAFTNAPYGEGKRWGSSCARMGKPMRLSRDLLERSLHGNLSRMAGHGFSTPASAEH